MTDIHNYKRRLEKTLENINKSDVSKENKDLMLRFHDECITQGLSICKIERYLYDISRLAKIVPNFQQATKEELRRVIIDLEKKDWTSHTKHSFKVMIRKFYKFVDGVEGKGVYPDRVSWIKPSATLARHKLPEELINEDEAKRMISHCETNRDRALLAILFESGCRIGEIGGIRIKDIVFDQHGALVNVSGKTGSRRIRLINSIPYLQEWLNKHPENEDPSSYLWINRANMKPLGYNRLVDIIKESALKAGLKKRIYAHLFRHSRATLLANYLTESQMKAYLGWNQSSKMAAIYVHLSGRDTDNAILKMNGVSVIEEKKASEKFKVMHCPRCKMNNESTNKFCKLCGFILDEKQAQEMIKKDYEHKELNSIINNLIEDPEIKALIQRKLEISTIQK